MLKCSFLLNPGMTPGGMTPGLGLDSGMTPGGLVHGGLTPAGLHHGGMTPGMYLFLDYVIIL